MNYLYEALDGNGQPVYGKLEARDVAEAQRRLSEMGYRPQSLAPNAAPAPAPLGDLPAFGMMSAPPAPQTKTPNTEARHSTLPPLSLLEGGLNAAPVRPGTLHAPAAPPTAYRQTGTAAAPAPRVSSVTLSGNAAKLAARTRQTPPRPTAIPVPGQMAVDPNASKLAGVSTRDLMFFFRQLGSLVHSGMSVYSALDNLAARTQNRNLATTAVEMADAARTGNRISDVMAHYPRIYPDHITGTVRAGELGGFLEIALEEIARNYEANIALYRGSWIPKVMAMQAWFVLALAQPAFPTLFPYANFALYLKLVLFRNLPISLGLYLLVKWGFKRLQLPEYRRWRDTMALKMPPFGDLQRQIALGAFLRMLGRLYKAGVAPINAWEGAMNTASNVAIRDRLAASYAMMQQGVSLPDAFMATGLFHGSVEQLVVTGHQSGQVVEMLDQAAQYYEENSAESSKKAKFMMLRLGVLAMLIFGGAAMCWMAYTYFHGLFKFIEDFFGSDATG